jgi:hypothetical protein
MSSSTRYSQTPSAYVPPSTRDSKFRTHKNKKQNYSSVRNYLSLRRADHPSRGVLLSVVCLSVIMNLRQWEGLGTLELLRRAKITSISGSVPREVNAVMNHWVP